MADKSDRRFPLWAFFCVPAAVLALYMGAYYLMVTAGGIDVRTSVGIRTQLGPAYGLGRSVYGFAEEGAEWFFEPAHRFDIILRPKTWDREIHFERYIEKEQREMARKQAVFERLKRKKAEAEKSVSDWR